MKETIYTIPLNDAFDKDSECPICSFMKQEEQTVVEKTVGSGMMEPEFREITNKKGFCNKHHSMILKTENKLSISLVTETRMRYVLQSLLTEFKNIDFEKRNKIFKKGKNYKANLSERIENLEKMQSSCAVCDILHSTQERFIKNLVYLYKKEPEFKNKVLKSKGFCMPHFIFLLKTASDMLSDKELESFTKEIYALQTENFSRVANDTFDFSQMFDYKNKGEKKENTKDALKRSALKLISYTDND